jgi:hypothetical protein
VSGDFSLLAMVVEELRPGLVDLTWLMCHERHDEN